MDELGQSAGTSASVADRGPLLVPWNAAADGTALVCIPWAGAGAAPFRAWGRIVGDSATVYGVRLPGRESRHAERFALSMGTLVTELVDEIAALPVPRVALFGQCSGALLAFETAHALAHRSGTPRLVHLFAAAQLPPRAIAERGVSVDADLTRYVPAALRSEPEIVDVLLPILAADMGLVAGYQYTVGEMLDVPLTVFHGGDDGELTAADAAGWRDETRAGTEVCEIAGADHLFGGPAWSELARAIGMRVG
jgi:surfactin synthase thioesterase subunit